MVSANSKSKSRESKKSGKSRKFISRKSSYGRSDHNILTNISIFKMS